MSIYYGTSSHETAPAQAATYMHHILTLLSDIAYTVRVETDGHTTLIWHMGDWEALTGYPHDELHARGGLAAIIHPDDVEILARRHERLAAGDRVTDEYRILTRNGETRWLSDHAGVVRDETHTPRIAYIHGAIQDITARKQIELEVRKLNTMLEQELFERAEEFERQASDLRQSQTLLQGLLENSPMAILVKSIHGTYLLGNRHASLLTGLPTERFLGKRDDELFPPDIAQEIVDADRQLLLMGRPSESEQVIIQDDVPRTFLKIMFPMYDAQSNPYAIGAFLTDMTERKHAEQEIRLFRTLVENSPDGIAILDTDGVITSANFAYRVMLWENEDPTGHNVAESLAVLPRSMSSLPTFVLEYGVWQGVITCRRSDDTQFPAQISAFLIRNERGTVQAIAVIMRDVSMQQQFERRLSEMQQMLRLVLDNLPQSIAWKDVNLNYMGCNRRFADHAGLPSPDAIIGLSDYDMPWAHTVEWIQQDDRQTIETNTPRYNQEIHSQLPDGTIVWMSYSKIPLHRADGSVFAMLIIYENIDHRKQMEEDQRRMIAVLDNSSDFIAFGNLDGGVYYVNKAGQQLVGLESLEEATSKKIFEYHVLDQENKQILDEVFAVVHAQGSWSGELLFRHFRTGELIPAYSTIFQVRDPTTGQVVGVANISRDIREQKRAEFERLQLQQQIIMAQQDAIRELSSPLLPLANGVLALPLIGSIDATRAQQVMETLLEGISRYDAEIAIVDITGVTTVDMHVVQALASLAQAVQLLGARVILTGIQPQIAQKFIQLGADLPGVVTRSTLQDGIAYALRGIGARR